MRKSTSVTASIYVRESTHVLFVVVTAESFQSGTINEYILPILTKYMRYMGDERCLKYTWHTMNHLT